MTTNIAKEQLKTVTKSVEFELLVYKVFLAMAEAQVTREKVDSYAIPLFRSMNFVEDQRHKDGAKLSINDPKYAYLALDSNGKNSQLDYYDHLLHLEHIKHGFPIDETGKCPALIAEYSQTKAENKLLKYMEENIAMPEWTRLEDREALLKLYLSIGADSAERIKNVTFNN